jgi:hypothetical protein
MSIADISEDRVGFILGLAYRPSNILPKLNDVRFCSPGGLGSDKSARVLANWLRAVIHQLFAAPGVDACDCQLAMKFAASTELAAAVGRNML